MNKPKPIEFQGEQYFDDRMFVLYLCAGKVEIEDGEDGAVWTSIYHNNPPKDHIWCIATYWNFHRYPMYSIRSFYKKEDAIAYMKVIEPETPLISSGGRTPSKILSYGDYLLWKSTNNLNEYDWRSLYLSDGSNAGERVGQSKEQFEGIK